MHANREEKGEWRRRTENLPLYSLALLIRCSRARTFHKYKHALSFILHLFHLTPARHPHSPSPIHIPNRIILEKFTRHLYVNPTIIDPSLALTGSYKNKYRDSPVHTQLIHRSLFIFVLFFNFKFGFNFNG